MRFEDQKLTSFSGLTVFQTFVEYISLKKLLGYRELRHIRLYQDDPMVKRLLGLSKLSGVIIEVRMDSEFFSGVLIDVLENNDIEYIISVPFNRLLILKSRVEKRRNWGHLIGMQIFLAAAKT